MDGSEVALAALGIMSLTVGALVWLLKKQFIQNESTMQNNTTVIGELKQVLVEFKEAFATDDADRRAFQACVVKSLTKNSEVLDKISARQDEIYETLTATNMTVQNLYVMHEVKDVKK